MCHGIAIRNHTSLLNNQTWTSKIKMNILWMINKIKHITGNWEQIILQRKTEIRTSLKSNCTHTQIRKEKNNKKRLINKTTPSFKVGFSEALQATASESIILYSFWPSCL